MRCLGKKEHYKMILYRRRRRNLLKKYIEEPSKYTEKEKDGLYEGFMRAEQEVSKYRRQFNIIDRAYRNSQIKIEFYQRKIQDLESSLKEFIEADWKE